MHCTRCNGLMFAERYDDMLASPGQAFHAMRCPLCGDIVDSVIARHRQQRIEPRARQVQLAVVVSA